MLFYCNAYFDIKLYLDFNFENFGFNYFFRFFYLKIKINLFSTRIVNRDVFCEIFLRFYILLLFSVVNLISTKDHLTLFHFSFFHTALTKNVY